jgi:hypothetical protein
MAKGDHLSRNPGDRSFSRIMRDVMVPLNEPKTQPVTFRGMLWGRGGNAATCTVSATAVTLPGAIAIYYTAYSITNVLLELPAGQYKLLTNGETIPVTHRNGGWEFRSQSEN